MAVDEKLVAELGHHSRMAKSAGREFVRGKRRFWESVLSQASQQAGRKLHGPVIEIGNGPFGAFLALDGKEQVYCIDPLNNEYRGLFQHLGRTKSVTFITEEAETAHPLPPASTLICYNALDHMDDPEAAIANMLRLASDDAVFIIGVDYYPYGVLKSIMHLLRKQLDLPHPNHYTQKDLELMFRPHFEVLGWMDTSKFIRFKEDLPASGTGPGGLHRLGPGRFIVDLAYRVAYAVGKKFGMGGKEPNLGIKKMAVCVMKKRGETVKFEDSSLNDVSGRFKYMDCPNKRR